MSDMNAYTCTVVNGEVVSVQKYHRQKIARVVAELNRSSFNFGDDERVILKAHQGEEFGWADKLRLTDHQDIYVNADDLISAARKALLFYLVTK